MPANDLALDYALAVSRDLTGDELGEAPAPASLRQVSDTLGQACIQLVSGGQETDRAAGLLLEARQNLAFMADSAARVFQQSRLLLNGNIPVIEAAGQPARLEEARLLLHSTVVGQLSDVLGSLPPPGVRLDTDTQRAVGDLSELTALGLLTRLAQPRLLPVPALRHQDATRVGVGADNFDIFLLEAPERQMVITHKIQVKAGCLGYCGVAEPRPRRGEDTIACARRNVDVQAQRQAAQHSARQRYASDIVLVSGCCDLCPLPRKARTPRGTARLIMREYAGRISGQEIQTLDDISNRLLLTVSGDESRRGMRQPARHTRHQ